MPRVTRAAPEPPKTVGRGSFETNAPEPEKRDRSSEFKFHNVCSIEAVLRYRCKKVDSSDKEELRWYYLGGAPVAFVQIHVTGAHRSGNIAVHINSRPGNGGTWFATEKQAHAFLQAEFERLPTPAKRIE